MAKLNELPFAVEAPDKQMPKSDAGYPASETGEGQIPGYVQPWARCANCEYFDGEKQYCNKFKAPCDMDGSCPSFEEADAGGEAEEEAEGYGMEGEEGDD